MVLSFVLNAIRIIKLMRKKLVKHVTRMGRTEMLARFCWENLKEKDYLQDVRVDGRMLIQWDGVDWVDLPRCGVTWRAFVNTVMESISFIRTLLQGFIVIIISVILML